MKKINSIDIVIAVGSSIILFEATLSVFKITSLTIIMIGLAAAIAVAIGLVAKIIFDSR